MDLDLYRKWFVHRDDVFAEQQRDGAYFPVKRELEDIDLDEHLGGIASYGVYVIDPKPLYPTTDKRALHGSNTVKYAVFDLDTYDEAALEFLKLEVGRLVADVQPPVGADYRCLLLESSGGKGYHIWLFFSEPLPARQVRAWTEQVRTAYDNAKPSGAIAASYGWPALEIFPKQNEVPEGGFGNLVKLPFGVHRKTGARSEIKPSQGWANSVEEIQGLDVTLVPVPVAESASPSPSPIRRTDDGAKLPPFPCVAKIMQEGVGRGNRDNAMYHLALYFADQGVPREALLTLCLDVNESFDPPLTQREVVQKVDSALRAPHGSCKPDWLRDFCPGGEGCYAPGRGTGRRQQAPEPAVSYWQLSPEERRKLRAERAQ